MNCGFKVSHYKESILGFLNNDFISTTLIEEFMSQSIGYKKLILRHDIDHDIKLLEKITDAEHELGVTSTNFFRIRAKNYNLFSRCAIRIVEKLLKQGHEVGLHYEDLDLDEIKLDFLFSFLRAEFGKDTFKIVSPHEPNRCRNKNIVNWKKFGVLGDAYDKKLMENFKYISDSSCHWREGCMHNFADTRQSLYILTHPIWWYNNHPGECY